MGELPQPIPGLLEMPHGYNSASWWALSVDLTDQTLRWEENIEHEGDLRHGLGKMLTGFGSNWVFSETKLSPQFLPQATGG